MHVREHEQTLEKPEIVNIYGTACIENSPFECVAQEELDSMMRFIMSKEHLKLIILHVEFSNLSTRQLNGRRFIHIIGLQLSVKTTNLWETPQSYVYRYIGQDTWETWVSPENFPGGGHPFQGGAKPLRGHHLLG